MSEDNKVSLILKSPSETKQVTISLNATVQELRDMVCQIYSTSASFVCLICNGRIMRDSERLTAYSLKNGSNIHLIIKGAQKKKSIIDVTSKDSVQKSKEEPKQSSSTTSRSSFNSDLLSRVGDSEEMISASTELLKNLPSETIEAVMLNSPQLKKLLEEYPQMRSHFTGKNLKELLEVMSNPTMRKEVLKNYDNMMTQMRNTPGAMEALSRFMPTDFDINDLYSEEESVTGNFDMVRPNTSCTPAPNPWENSSGTTSSSRNQQSGTLPSNSSGTSGVDMQRQIQLMQNPAVAKAIADILNGMVVIQKEAPELLTSSGLPNIMALSSLIPQQQDIRRDSDQIPLPPTMQNINWEEKFQQQLKQLDDMGFKNVPLNIQALIVTEGDVELAVDWIIRKS